MSQAILKAIEEAKEKYSLQIDQISGEVIDVMEHLKQLLQSNQWESDQQSFFQSWMKKLDIAKKHYSQYDNDWRPVPNKTLVSHEHYYLSLMVAIQAIDRQIGVDSNCVSILKIINVIYKIIDYSRHLNSTLKAEIKSYLQGLIGQWQSKKVPVSPVHSASIKQQELPITVLFWEGPIARAYLESIKEMGFKVRKIIKMVSSVDLISKKKLGVLLPLSMRINYAANKQYKQIFYWPNLYKHKKHKTTAAIQDVVSEQLHFEQTTLQSATENQCLTEYSDQVETLLISGLKDQALRSKIEASKDSLFLFTGGGIVPNELLAIKGKKMIHIHPGFLPDIRGADCVLWSQLVANRLSASAFYLAPGIDVGDVICYMWLPELRVYFTQNEDRRVKYRMIYGFLDPWVRAYVLKQVINSTQGFMDLHATVQKVEEGETFHFMHESMKQLAFQKLNSKV